MGPDTRIRAAFAAALSRARAESSARCCELVSGPMLVRAGMLADLRHVGRLLGGLKAN